MEKSSLRSASLEPFFAPNGVAIIGASRDPSKLSYGVVRNLVDPERGYGGPVYPVNPKADEILGRRCYPDIGMVPDPVELAVLIIPAGMVCGCVEACGKRGIKAAVVISGGFREIGPEGAERERALVETAQRYGMRLMGPNGIGVIDTHTPLNTTFVKGMPPRGHIAFLSQSGALCGGVIDWTIGRGIGFSRFLSVGNEADVNETDLLPFLAADEESRVLALYLEDVKGGTDFYPALAAAAAVKPVLVLKAGRTASGQAATASHTGALAGAHAAFRAACKQAGAIEVESIQGLFNAGLALAYQPLPHGDRIAIITNAGGPAALAADALEPAGLRLARISPETQAVLRSFLIPDAQVAGPVDLLGGADENDYRRAVEAVLADPAVDGVLAILVPQALVNPVAVVEAWGQASRAPSAGSGAVEERGSAKLSTSGGAGGQGGSVPVTPSTASTATQKPVIGCLMGEASLDEAFAAAHRAQIPAYTFPEDAVNAFGILRRRGRWQAEEHNAPARPEGTDPTRAHDRLEAARRLGLAALGSAEGREVLEAYGIATPSEMVAGSPDEAAEYAEQIGYPVVLKLASPDILHKTDVGGVVLGIASAEDARAAYQAILLRARIAEPEARINGVQVQRMVTGGQEVIVGVTRDPVFGPLVMFGLGGVYVEALADVSFRLAPLTPADAEEMIGEVRSARLLRGLRGAPPADRAALVDAIVRVGQLAADCPEIAELDVNPLLVLPEGQGALAVDVRIILA